MPSNYELFPGTSDQAPRQVDDFTRLAKVAKSEVFKRKLGDSIRANLLEHRADYPAWVIADLRGWGIRSHRDLETVLAICLDSFRAGFEVACGSIEAGRRAAAAITEDYASPEWHHRKVVPIKRAA